MTINDKNENEWKRMKTNETNETNEIAWKRMKEGKLISPSKLLHQSKILVLFLLYFMHQSDNISIVQARKKRLTSPTTSLRDG